MRVIIQKVRQASVTVGGKTTGSIGNGILVLASWENSDASEDLEWVSRKIVNLRIFSDEQGKMNRSLKDISGEVLIVSQFTLHASTKKGNRPSFVYAADPETARHWYNEFIKQMESDLAGPVQTGEFGKMMEVSLVNDGPVTIAIDSKNKM